MKQFIGVFFIFLFYSAVQFREFKDSMLQQNREPTALLLFGYSARGC